MRGWSCAQALNQPPDNSLSLTSLSLTAAKKLHPAEHIFRILLIHKLAICWYEILQTAELAEYADIVDYQPRIVDNLLAARLRAVPAVVALRDRIEHAGGRGRDPIGMRRLLRSLARNTASEAALAKLATDSVGEYCYDRPDGVAVVPLTALGP